LPRVGPFLPSPRPDWRSPEGLDYKPNPPNAAAGFPVRFLRFMPDFVVQSMQNGDLFYLEVKFRADGFFSFNDRYWDFPYHNAWFVIVSPDKIQCMHFKRLKAGYGIRPDTKYELAKVKSFHIDPAVLAEYETYTRQIFVGFKKD
jgi:hypothetical protein